MVVVEMAAGAIPVAGVVAATIMARRDPVSAHVRRTAPVAFVPAVMAGNRIPITAHPNIIGGGLHRCYDNGTRRRRRADLNANRYLSFRRNSCQQKCRNRGSF